MLTKKIKVLELCGFLFIIILSVFLQNLYQICNYNLLGIMFGCVNDSIWEHTKVLLLAFALWSIIELMCVKVPFYKFVVAKTISLYLFGVLYISICWFFSLFNTSYFYLPYFIASAICFFITELVFKKLFYSKKSIEKLFMPSIIALLLFIAFYCSFTPFPPKIYIFMDRATNMYGLLPKNIDIGAIVLNTKS